MAPSYKTRMSSRSSIKSSKSSKSTESSLGIWIVLGLLLILIIIIIFAGGFYKRFEKFTNPPTLKYFYMETCPHCTDFNPVWDKLESKITNDKINIKLVKYNLHDGNSGEKEASKYEVSGAPTIILDDINNKAIEYKGNRTVDDIITFIKENTK